jgi:hypothetical protein
VTLDVTVLLVAIAVAAIGFPSKVDITFVDRLLTAIGARTNGGTVSCTIPGDLPVGRRFECHGIDTAGNYTVEVTIVDERHDFRLVVARAI